MRIIIHLIWGIKEGFIGGTERFVLDLAKGLKEKGSDVFIVCSNINKEIQIEGIKVLGSVPKQYINKIARYGYANENFFKNEIIGKKFTQASIQRFSKYVSDQLKEFDADIFFLNSFMYSTFLEKNLPLKRFIVTNHETPEELENYWGEHAFEVFQKAIHLKECVLKDIKILATPAAFYANLFSKLLKRDVVHIPFGIDLLKFSGVARSRELKKEYCKENETLILLPARFDIRQKGHDIALQALSIVKKQGYHFKAVFTGYDKDAYEKNRSILDDLLKKTGLESNIILTKFNHILDAFAICDFVVLPERFASYGLALSESLALGIQTILTPIPSYKEIALGYSHAHIIENFSPKTLAKAIIQLIKAGHSINSSEGQRFRGNNDVKKCVNRYYIQSRAILLKCVLFDMDGVIVDSERHWATVEYDFLKSHIPSWNKEYHKKIIGRSINDLYLYLKDIHKLHLQKEVFMKEYAKIGKEIYENKVMLSHHIIDLLERLKSCGIIMGICSSSPRVWIDIILKRFRLKKYFKYSLSAEEIVTKSKPAPDIYLHALKEIGFDRDSCFVIEDSENGVLSAKNAKLFCVGYRNVYNAEQSLESADIIIDDLLKLTDGNLRIFRG